MMWCIPKLAWRACAQCVERVWPQVFDVPTGSLSVIIFASVVLSLAFAAFTVSAQLQAERKRAELASLHQKARRLRWNENDHEVVPPPPPENGYHLFLSQ